MDAEPIGRAGLVLLLETLKAEGKVRFVRFYDGKRETEQRLPFALFQIHPDRESPGLVMDFAVDQLRHRGLGDDHRAAREAE